MVKLTVKRMKKSQTSLNGWFFSSNLCDNYLNASLKFSIHTIIMNDGNDKMRVCNLKLKRFVA